MSTQSVASPRWGRIADGMRRSGLSRGKLYNIAARHAGLFRKIDQATLVDLKMLDKILAASPPAKLAGTAEARARE